ncbi:MAG: polysaccharide biosynthesis protein [Eubacteriales bacterium]
MNFLSKRKLILLSTDIVCFSIVCSIFNIVSYLPYLTMAEKLYNEALLLGLIFLARILFKSYSSIWRYAGSVEYLELVSADFFGGCLYLVISRAFFPKYINLWYSIGIVATTTLSVLSLRFIYQFKCANIKNSLGDKDKNKINVAIVGAGKVGKLLAQELLLDNNAHYKPFCFIDKDKQKVGNKTSGIPVYDSESNILERINNMPIQEIVIALPDLSGDEKQELFDFYKQTGCKVKVYDFPLSQLDIENGKRQLRDLKIEDLLFRDIMSFDNTETRGYYNDKTILITGGGGSIGSELCRQIAKLKPKKIIILDIYENNAYDIHQDIIRRYNDSLDIVIEIASVRDSHRMDEVFDKYRPDVVFHAAAHKHVHLMEHNSAEAIKNNIFGTYNTANSAEKYGVKRFIMISTDKAVNPTNIMGASKRMCEMIIQSRKDSATDFVAVRFGNVLGSNGSVIPLFKRMIENGGPITITDKRIVRYFMTIPEAAQLVLQTGAMASKSEIYVLDMGKPIKILDLAENMVKLSGLIPYQDIDIVEIGLRPGEKLYEELLIKTEVLDKTKNKMIFIERDRNPSREEIEQKLGTLNDALRIGGNEAVRIAMMQVVPTFHNPDEVNCKACDAEEMKDAERSGTAELTGVEKENIILEVNKVS